MLVCFVAARRDAARRERLFGKRVLVAALLTVVAYFLLMAVLLIMVIRSRPPGANVGIAFTMLFGLGGFIFLLAAFTGAIGYAISYRIYQRTGMQNLDPTIDPETRLDETGNPYQPPPSAPYRSPKH